MRCVLCGHKFSKEEADKACSSCLKKECGLVKCPKCGFEDVEQKD